MNLTKNKQIDVGTRLGSMFLDHLFMTMIAMAFFIPGMVSGFAEAFKVTHEQTSPNFMGGGLGYIGLLGFSLYFCKDCVNGRSIAKRILKLQVVDNSTGQVASPIKCFIRDLFIVLWPIEAIISLINTSRRLGDRIAGTKLVTFDSTLEQPKINIENIKYDYRVKGDQRLSWYPTSVFEDGKKVFIRMSDHVDSSQLPVFMMIDRSGRLGKLCLQSLNERIEVHAQLLKPSVQRCECRILANGVCC